MCKHQRPIDGRDLDLVGRSGDRPSHLGVEQDGQRIVRRPRDRGQQGGGRAHLDPPASYATLIWWSPFSSSLSGSRLRSVQGGATSFPSCRTRFATRWTPSTSRRRVTSE